MPSRVRIQSGSETLVHFLFCFLGIELWKGSWKDLQLSWPKWRTGFPRQETSSLLYTNFGGVSHFSPYYFAALFYYFFRLPIRNFTKACFSILFISLGIWFQLSIIRKMKKFLLMSSLPCLTFMFKGSDPALVALTPCPAISNHLPSNRLCHEVFYVPCTCPLDVVFLPGWANPAPAVFPRMSYVLLRRFTGPKDPQHWIFLKHIFLV